MVEFEIPSKTGFCSVKLHDFLGLVQEFHSVGALFGAPIYDLLDCLFLYVESQFPGNKKDPEMDSHIVLQRIQHLVGTLSVDIEDNGDGVFHFQFTPKILGRNLLGYASRMTIDVSVNLDMV